MKAIVRRAKEEDYEALKRLYIQDFQHHVSVAPEEFKEAEMESVPFNRGAFITALEGDQEFYAIAEVDGHAVGMVNAVYEEDEGDNHHHPYRRVSIEDIFVVPEHRSDGIARQLTASAEKWAGEKGAEYLTAIVYAANAEGVSFFEKNGFQPYTVRYNRQIEK